MSTEQTKSTVRRLVYELFNRTNVQVADEIVAPGYVEHDPILGRWSGSQGLKQLSRSLRAAFPDGHLTINDQVAEGDRVVTRWAFRGRQLCAFAGIPARGGSVWLTAISIHRVAEGRIQEGWTGIERVKWGGIEGSAAAVLRKAQGPERYLWKSLSFGCSVWRAS
jgi:predicted ester cyclase